MDNEDSNGGIKKSYYSLPLELNALSLMPLSWTIVHPIDKRSPLFELSKEKIQKLNPEIIVLIQGFDEVFSQNINTKKSFVGKNWLWNKKFARIFTSNQQGDIELDLNRINDIENI